MGEAHGRPLPDEDGESKGIPPNPALCQLSPLLADPRAHVCECAAGSHSASGSRRDWEG